MWTVIVLEQATEEIDKLPKSELSALIHAMDKLEAMGPQLGYPHCSAVQTTSGELRELRLRAGRSPWRALYQRVGEVMVIAAVAPEAQHDRRGFARAVRHALDRLDEMTEG